MTDYILGDQIGIEVKRNENGHYIAICDGEVVAGPYFNKPAFTKRYSKGEWVTCVVQDPYTDDPKYYILLRGA